ncbi:MAG: hypothetical protein HZC17_01405 [Candidatus Omnitrophica bacterium]|nr:hypothetical protein [Candidatus Omnitrophota bacterium]
MSTEKKKLAGVGELFSASWSLYKSRFWTLITIGVIASLILFLFQGVFILLGAAKNIPSANISFFFMIAVNFLAVLCVIVITLWSSAALIFAISKASESMGAVEAGKKAWAVVMKYFVVSFLAALVVAAGMILFVIPGIYLAVGLSMAPLVAIIEYQDVTIVSALKKSRAYVKGYWWPVFGRFLFLLLILFGFGIILGLLLFLPLTFFASLSREINSMLRPIGSALIDVILTPFSTIYWFMIYSGLKQMKQTQELS